MMVQMNGLCRAVAMERAKCGRVILVSVVSCSLSEVRSGRFEGRGLGVLSRLETGRRGKGRSGQRVGRQDSECVLTRHCLSVAASGRATVRYLRVCSHRVVVDARSNRWMMINRERPARFSWRRCLASWMVNGESDGGELEEKGEFLPFLPCLSLVLPSLPALSRLGFDLERAGAGGEGGCGCTVLSTGTMQCNLRMDCIWEGKPRLSNVGGGGDGCRCCCPDTLVGKQAHTHTYTPHTAQRRAHGTRWEQQACRRGRKA